jgi:hypothetical protein
VTTLIEYGRAIWPLWPHLVAIAVCVVVPVTVHTYAPAAPRRVSARLRRRRYRKARELRWARMSVEGYRRTRT